MKRIIFVLFLSLAWTLPLQSSDDTLTAEELAQHLEVSSWVSKMHLQEDTLILQVFHVVNGKVAETPLLGTAAYPTDREFTKVAILASQRQGKTHLSIKPAAGPAVSAEATTIPLPATIPLPTVITVGDYILGGDLPLDGVTQINPAKIRDVKDGLLLRVTKKA